MIHIKDNLQVPVVVTNHKDGSCDVYVPDFSVTIHGIDFLAAMADAIMKISAIYYYNIERNVEFELSCTYNDAQDYCMRHKIRHAKRFATYICLTT